MLILKSKPFISDNFNTIVTYVMYMLLRKTEIWRMSAFSGLVRTRNISDLTLANVDVQPAQVENVEKISDFTSFFIKLKQIQSRFYHNLLLKRIIMLQDK